MIRLRAWAIYRDTLFPYFIVPINHILEGFLSADELVLGGWHHERVQIHQQALFGSILQRKLEIIEVFIVEQCTLGNFDGFMEETLTKRNVFGHRASTRLSHKAAFHLKGDAIAIDFVYC